MPKPKVDEIDFIDSLLNEFRKDNSIQVHVNNFIESYIEGKNIKLPETEIYHLKLVISTKNAFERVEDENFKPTEHIILNQNGIDFLEKYGSYAAYKKIEEDEKRQIELKEIEQKELEKKKQDKKEKAEAFSNRLKNWTAIATIIFGAATIVLSILSIKQKADIGHIQDTLEQQSKKMDSILQYKSSNKPNK